MELQPVTLELQNAMNVVDGATIVQRIRINLPDEGNARCKSSRALDPRKDFSQCIPLPTTHSTSNVISPRQERTEPSGPRLCRSGVKLSLRREPDVPSDLLRALSGNMTEPLSALLRPPRPLPSRGSSIPHRARLRGYPVFRCDVAMCNIVSDNCPHTA
jgi:hypothetical protein